MTTEVHDILDALGIEITAEQGDEVQGLCPMHEQRTGRADRNPSWWINTDTGASICFSCDYRSSLSGLVVDVLGLHTDDDDHPDWAAAEKWLAEYRDPLEVAARKFKEREFQRGDRPAPLPMNDARLALFTEVPDWALKARGLELAAVNHYGVLWDADEQAWITPLRTEDGTLMGWQVKGQVNRIFRNYPPGIQKSQTLYGIDVWRGPRMIVVESPLDCVRLRSAGIDGAVATFGASISDRQIELMTRADEIILAFDRDEAGYHALDKFYEVSAKRGIDFKQFAYNRTDNDAKDPGDMTDAEITKGIHHALHSIWGIDQLRKA